MNVGSKLGFNTDAASLIALGLVPPEGGGALLSGQ